MSYTNQASYKKETEDEYEEEEYNDNHDLITINLRSTSIQLKYSQLCKYSLLIPRNYLITDITERLSKDIQQFEEENGLNEDNVIYFFKLFDDEKVTITNDNFRDLFKISDLLQVNSFIKRLNKYKRSHTKDIDFIITSILQELKLQEEQANAGSKFKIQMEEELIDKVNDCLLNKKFKDFPVSIIFNIIEKSDKTDLSIDILFDFIKETIDKNYVLLAFLDIKKLSYEKFLEFQEMTNNSNDTKMDEYLQYLKFDFEYTKKTKKIEDMKNKFKNKFKKEEEKNKSLQKQINSLLKENQDLKKNMNQKEKENQDLKDIIKQKEKENQDLKDIINKKEKENQTQINELLDKIDKLHKKFTNFNISNENFSLGLNSFFSPNPNPKATISFLNISSKEGNCYASYLLGLMYEQGKYVKIDYSKSQNCFELSGLQGNSFGYRKIGSNYKKGIGVEIDYDKAVEFYQKSIELGNSTALIDLGSCYEKGQGVKQNYSKAIKCYEQSIDLNNSYALISLAICYENGLGVEQDHKKAFDYYMKSSENKNFHALNNLGNCFYYALGVESNYDIAFDYYRSSAKHGNSTALINLGMCYENGHGVEQNIQKAMELYQESADLGNPEGEFKLKELQKNAGLFQRFNFFYKYEKVKSKK